VSNVPGQKPGFPEGPKGDRAGGGTLLKKTNQKTEKGAVGGAKHRQGGQQTKDLKYRKVNLQLSAGAEIR